MDEKKRDQMRKGNLETTYLRTMQNAAGNLMGLRNDKAEPPAEMQGRPFPSPREGMSGRTAGEEPLPIGAKELKDFTLTLQKYKTGKKHLETRVVNAENWWKLRNAFEAEKAGTLPRDGFKSQSAWLHNVISSKHADAMEAYPEANVLPREEGDRQEARELSSIIPCILEQNRFEKVYDLSHWRKFKTGTGVYKVIWDPDKQGGLGDISIKSCDLLNLFWEPGVDDIQDSPYFFHTQLADIKELESQYPQLQGKGRRGSFRATEFVWDDLRSTEDKTTVIDVYYHRTSGGKRVLHYCKYVGDVVLYSTENEEARRGFGLYERPEALTGADVMRGGSIPETTSIPPAAQAPSLAQGRYGAGLRAAEGVGPYGQGGLRDAGMPGTPAPTGMPGIGSPSSAPAGHLPPLGEGQPEHRGLYDHGKYPFVFDPLYPIEGSPCGYGFVDLCINPQIAIDLMRGAIVKNTVVGATPRYFQQVDGAINEEEFRDVTQEIIHVSGSLDDRFIKLVDYKQLSGNQLNAMNSIIQELRETSGNTETATGSTSAGVTAASAIAALQEASGKGSRDSSLGSYRAFGEVVELCIELVRQFYDMPRKFRITGEDGGEQFTTFDNSGLRPMPQAPVGGMSMGYRLPVFDVKVKAQKRNAYSRMSQNELALELFGAGFMSPQLAEPALICLDMMEFEGREKLIQKIQAQATMVKRLQAAVQIALALAQRFAPEQLPMIAQQLGMDPAAMGAPAPQVGADQRAVEGAGPYKSTENEDGKKEHGIVTKARERANAASQPGGGA